ncbi:cell division protein FtsQ/DivIB [Litorihabitans aurantiacus]|uniref:POTRA domain-containing protein n=1 Tax=Litorihabitans aurantiacus TaxID=1930061 RepID=A0AA37XFI2_9MICO|nr:FtsQ-type POTRA domain-containing protein [Litorihabitans aurantiacus]GMA31715.1 hypothetical protein GCM10025875_17070 [Litorihabitans aurantiacus]
MRPPAAPRRPATATPRRPSASRGAGATGVRGGTAPARRDASGPDRGQDLIILDDDGPEDEHEGGSDGVERAAQARVLPAPRSLEPAWAARDAARRRATWVRVGVVTAAAAALGGLGWLTLASPVFALEAEEVVVVGGGPYVDPTAVVGAAAQDEGTPLLRLDTAALRDRIEQLPAVAEVEVARDLPRGLTLTVVAREPVALVAQPDGAVQVVGSDGVVITTVPGDAAPAGLPVLAVDTAAPEAGRMVEDVLAVLAVLPPDLLGQVASAGASAPGSIRFELVDGAQVTWGGVARSELKAAVLSTLLQVGARTYDVSEPESPVTS